MQTQQNALKIIDNSSPGGYGLCLQWGQCWFEFRSCKRHCQPQSSKTCSVPPGEQMYLLSIFFTCWRKTTISLWHNKNWQAEVISKRSTKCRPNVTECIDSAFSDLFEGFIWYQNRYFDLQESLWNEHQPFTYALSKCERLHSCPKSLPRLIILIIYVITSYDELSADAIIVDGCPCTVINPLSLTYLSLVV